MVINVAINGFGRIGRMFFRAAYQDKNIKIVAVNDLTPPKTLAHLLKYDSVHGTLNENISSTDKSIIVGKQNILVFAEKDPSKLPWKKLNIHTVIESTGFFCQPKDASAHLSAGAKKVILSAPFKVDSTLPKNALTVVMGVNHKAYHSSYHNLISNASCTTNCLAPLLKILHEHLKIKHCYFTTVHAYTADQHLVDSSHKDLRRARSAALNIVPTSTGADIAVSETIPSLSGKVKGLALRVPVADGSITDFSIETEKNTSAEEVNHLIKKAAEGQLKGIIQYSDEELVSTDIVGNPCSAIFDSKLTKVICNTHLKVVAWYDNEWGYSCRLVDLVKLVK